MIDLDELEKVAKSAVRLDRNPLAPEVTLKPELALELIAEIRRYKEALEWYADESNMKSLTGLPYGRRARAALEKKE